MKRPLFLVLPLLIIVLLAVFGNRMIASTLDARLPALLTDTLGLPVSIAPINVSLLRLTAQTDQLVMGQQDQPAVKAQAVSLSLTLAGLLKGRLQFDHVSAEHLLVQPDRWPRGDHDDPDEDFTFLDPWLPDVMAVTAGRYVDSEGTATDVSALHWHRHGEGQVELRASDASGNVTLAATINSLGDVLALNALQADLTLQAAQQEDSEVRGKLAITPSAAG
ncbi:MAG: hypothetical protein AAGA91_16915, partial [Pseudomonadota bacterium]